MKRDMLPRQKHRRSKTPTVPDWFSRTNPDVAKSFNRLKAFCDLIESESGQSNSPFHETLQCILTQILTLEYVPAKVASGVTDQIQEQIDNSLARKKFLLSELEDVSGEAKDGSMIVHNGNKFQLTTEVDNQKTTLNGGTW